MLYIDPLGLDTAGITWHIRIPEVVAGGDNSMAYVSAMEAGRAAGDRARREANFNNGMQEAYSGRGSSTVSKAELEERRRAEQAAARYRAYVANRSNYGRNGYSPSLGPQTADEWETFGDFLGSFEILFVAQLGDLISLGANIIKGSRSGILMSAAGFIPFGSQFKLAAKTGEQLLLGVGKFPRVDYKFGKHAGDWFQWGSISKPAYYNRAVRLSESPIGGKIMGFTSPQGWNFRFNSATGEFLTTHPTGYIETFYRPTGGMNYYLNQISKYGN